MTGEPFQVAPQGIHPRLSNDATLVFEQPGRSPRRELAWLDREGRRVEQVLQDDLEGLTSPVLSPDERRVALMDVSQSDLWIGDLERGTCTRVTSQGFRMDPLYWSAASDEVFCISVSAARGSHHHVLVDADGMDAVRTLVDEHNRRAGNCPAPVVYGTWSEGTGYDLWLLPAGDGAPFALVATAGREGNAVISRDGALLAWVSTKNGRDEVFVTTFPEPGPQLQVSATGGQHPRWSEESLFFVAGENVLMEVRVESAPALRLAEVRRVLAGSAVGVDLVDERYGVSADGQRILVLQDPSRGQLPPRIVVVENWLEEFKDR